MSACHTLPVAYGVPHGSDPVRSLNASSCPSQTEDLRTDSPPPGGMDVANFLQLNSSKLF